MLDQKVHVLGDDDIVLMLGLLGIQGTIIETGDSFLEIFNNLIKDTSIGMVIIALQLSNSDYDSIKGFYNFILLLASCYYNYTFALFRKRDVLVFNYMLVH